MDYSISRKRCVPESSTTFSQSMFYDRSRKRNSRAYRNLQKEQAPVEDCLCDCPECSKTAGRNERTNKFGRSKKLCNSLKSPISKARIECVCRNQEAAEGSSCSRYCRCPEQVFPKLIGWKHSSTKLSKSQKSTNKVSHEFRRRPIILTREQYRKFQEHCRALKFNEQLCCCTPAGCISQNFESSPRERENFFECDTETDSVCSRCSDKYSKYTNVKSTEEMRNFKRAQCVSRNFKKPNTLNLDRPISSCCRQCNENPMNVAAEYNEFSENVWDLKNAFQHFKISEPRQTRIPKMSPTGREFPSNPKFKQKKSSLPHDVSRNASQTDSQNYTCSCSSSSAYNRLKDPVRTLESFCEKVKAINRSEPIVSVSRSWRTNRTDSNITNFDNVQPCCVKKNFAKSYPAKVTASRRHSHISKSQCCSCCRRKYSWRSDVVNSPKTNSSGLAKFHSPKSQQILSRDKSRGRPLKKISKKMLIYPPDGKAGPPLSLFRDSSSVDCRIKGNPRKGFRYDVTYIQNFVSPTWRLDEESTSTKDCDENNEKCSCWMDHG